MKPLRGGCSTQKNEAQQQPLINRQIAGAYLAVGDPEITRRT